MKVDHTSIFLGDTGKMARKEGIQTEEKKSGTAVFAGDFNNRLDPVAKKKQKAKQQAMKIVGDAFAGDCKIDDDLEERRNKISRLREERHLAKKEIYDIENRREELRESYGVEKDSREYQELLLLEKEVDAKMPGKRVFLTKEEREEIARIKAEGLTEYQERSLGMKEDSSYYEKQAYELELEIKAEEMVIRSTKIERLKSSPMAEANKEADAIMASASEEIISMLMEEAKEHIDEEMEEKKEAAEKKAEEEKEREEKLESAKEKKEEQEELTEVITEASRQMTELGSLRTEVQDEVQKMLDKMKLLEEDIKGAAVDESL